nr:MAG TPA: hypothetical protein [Caudoviricetes sp.]
MINYNRDRNITVIFNSYIIRYTKTGGLLKCSLSTPIYITL